MKNAQSDLTRCIYTADYLVGFLLLYNISFGATKIPNFNDGL